MRTRWCPHDPQRRIDAQHQIFDTEDVSTEHPYAEDTDDDEERPLMRRSPMVTRRPVGKARRTETYSSYLPLKPAIDTPPSGAHLDLGLLRERRRKVMPVRLGGDFPIHVEVCEICTPVAIAISRLKKPLAMRKDVNEIADAVHDVLSTMVGIIAESRTLPDDARARSRQAVSDLAVRPGAPTISDEQIISGSWPMKLADSVSTYSGDLAAVLGRALPPGHPRLKAELSISERVERALRGLDSILLATGRRVPKVRDRQALPSIADYNAQQQAQADARRAERALAKIGAV